MFAAKQALQFKMKHQNFSLILLLLTITEFSFAQISTSKKSLLLDTLYLKEVIISASRTAEPIMETPVTVERISSLQLQKQPSSEFISSLSRLKGVDVSQSSWLITSFSTRGFNSSKAERVVQLADYVDVTSPTASLYYGNWVGIGELDLESADIVYGANSALYGSNAFNGVLLMHSKDPFKYQGLSASLRGGNRSMIDGQIRWAKVLGNRWAIKFNANYFEADEFLSSNNAAIKRVTSGGLAGSDPLNNATGNPAGWNAINRYGDAGTTVTNAALTALNNNANYRIYTLGYTEAEMANWSESSGNPFKLFNNGKYKAGNYRLNPSLHWQISPKLRAVYEYKLAVSNGIFQSTSRYAQRGMKYDLHRIELKSDKWFVRAYTVFDYGGKAYDLNSLAGGLLNAPMAVGTQPNGNRYPTFAANYYALWNQVFTAARTTGLASGAVLPNVFAANPNGGVPTSYTLPQPIAGGQPIEAAQALASQLAAGVQLPVGSSYFNQLREQIVNGVGLIDVNGTKTVRGAAFANTARFWDISAQHEWTIEKLNIIAGASYRTHLLQSAGTLFSDGPNSPISPNTNDIQRRDRIVNWDGGAYGQLRYAVWQNRLKLAAAGRFDRFRNFGSRFSPRFSAVLSLGDNRQHNFRINYAQAYRQPAQLDQFIYLDFGTLLVAGNVEKGYQGLNAVSALPNGQPNPDFLKPITLKKIAPEQVNTWEIGYRAQLIKGLYVDMSFYRSWYNDFIGTLRFFGREDGEAPAGVPLPIASGDFAKPAADRTRGRLMQTWVNADRQVRTQGFMGSVEYFWNKKLNMNANYTWSHINENDVPGLIVGFNTPAHKVNIGIAGEPFKNTSYTVNYRHISGYTYFMPVDEGFINAFGTVDAQVNYRLPKVKSSLRLGGTNLMNTNAVQVYGAAAIGRVVYLGWTVEGI
ncbi:TonB-dependent receptor [Runella slithyformis DSM 19594]|uniref:TonB-dependent receptor n=1 Tax=Runella slithyformis (strain ATCC 29530 / DSM 19594 / LMG 11500 / NCIMB 11436 / LSU 4) TaxID=761193 RepID=A0A7U3ZNH1_RUNSL|nr:TonB-dependent receptor [Runella slithyformis DSM 19594]